MTKREVKAMVMDADQDGNGCVAVPYTSPATAPRQLPTHTHPPPIFAPPFSLIDFDEFTAMIESLSRSEVDIRREIMQARTIWIIIILRTTPMPRH